MRVPRERVMRNDIKVSELAREIVQEFANDQIAE